MVASNTLTATVPTDYSAGNRALGEFAPTSRHCQWQNNVCERLYIPEYMPMIWMPHVSRIDGCKAIFGLCH